MQKWWKTHQSGCLRFGQSYSRWRMPILQLASKKHLEQDDDSIEYFRFERGRRIIRPKAFCANKKMPPRGRRHYQFKGRACHYRYKEREAQTLPCICISSIAEHVPIFIFMIYKYFCFMAMPRLEGMH